jgi:hypothetical protein
VRSVERARRTGYEGRTCGSRTRRKDVVAAAARSAILRGVMVYDESHKAPGVVSD